MDHALLLLPFLMTACGVAAEGSFPDECIDGQDNDFDDLYDCHDPDCARLAVCGGEDTEADVDTDSDADSDSDSDTDADADSDADADADSDADADADSDADADVVTVAEIQRGLVSEGDIVTLDGVIATSGVTRNGAGFFVQDPGGGPYSGLWIYLGSVSFDVDPADRLTIEGEVSSYYGLSELVVSSASDIRRDGTGTAVATTLTSAPADWDPYEGCLLTLERLRITGAPDSYGQSDTNWGVALDDFFWTYQDVYGDGDLLTSVTGLLNYSYWEFQLGPRDADDLVP